jgi:hypothetical protein
MDAALRFLDILQILARHQVDYILVGGVAAILEGAPVSTFDVDIVVPWESENNARLLVALRELNSRYLDPAGRQIVPDESRLSSFRMHRLVTDHGPLDVMHSIGDNLTYADLTSDTHEYDVAGFQVRTLKLEKVILSKEQANRDKDKAALHTLRRALLLKGRSGS